MGWPWEGHEPDAGPTLVLLRHGRTRWNAERRFLGTTDIALDEVGVAGARALGLALQGAFDQVYASPLSRAAQTAAHLHPEPVPVPELRELHQGHLEGLHGAAAIARYPAFFAAWARDPTRARVPGGESLGECRDRALQAVEAIADRHAPGEVVALVTHQMVIAAITCSILDEPLTGWRRHGVRNLAASVLRRTTPGWRVLVEDWRFDDVRGPEGSDV